MGFNFPDKKELWCNEYLMEEFFLGKEEISGWKYKEETIKLHFLSLLKIKMRYLENRERRLKNNNHFSRKRNVATECQVNI